MGTLTDDKDGSERGAEKISRRDREGAGKGLGGRRGDVGEGEMGGGGGVGGVSDVGGGGMRGEEDTRAVGDRQGTGEGTEYDPFREGAYGAVRRGGGCVKRRRGAHKVSGRDETTKRDVDGEGEGDVFEDVCLGDEEGEGGGEEEWEWEVVERLGGGGGRSGGDEGEVGGEDGNGRRGSGWGGEVRMREARGRGKRCGGGREGGGRQGEVTGRGEERLLTRGVHRRDLT